MEGQKRQDQRQDIQAQCAYPTFMEAVLDTVERVLRNSAKKK
jgi:hypothetical protein